MEEDKTFSIHLTPPFIPTYLPTYCYLPSHLRIFQHKFVGEEGRKDGGATPISRDRGFLSSVTRLGHLLDFGKLFKAFGNV